MAFQRLEYTKSWNKSEDFPTYEPDEAQVRADLQLLHDEARDGLNRVVDALNDPGAAAQLPFAAEGLQADNVQDAIEEVYGAVQTAAAGKLVDGSVTAEKLDGSLLERIYGGRIWLQLGIPNENHNPDTGFPLGQQWLSPAFTAENLDTGSWSAAACAVEAQADRLTLTADGTMAAATVSQRIPAAMAGDRMLVRLQLADAAGAAVTLHLNGVQQTVAADGFYEGAADGDGLLRLVLTARWPSAEEAGSVTFHSFTVLDLTDIQRKTGARPMENWAEYLALLLPQTRSPRMGFVQTAPGQWERTDWEVLPVCAGGTGHGVLAENALLLGGGNQVKLLPMPAESGVLGFRDGTPGWLTATEAAQTLSMVNAAEGTYVGTGQPGTVLLPGATRLVVLTRVDGPVTLLTAASAEVLLQGSRHYGSYYVTEPDTGLRPYYTAGVTLSGSSLQFWVSASEDAAALGANAVHYNEKGAQYRWFALY